MSKTDQFRQYADEAIRWAFQSKTEKERQGRKPRCTASTFSASTTIRQKPGLCKARLSWRSPELPARCPSRKSYPRIAMA
jgi:hypothetical protein